MRRSIVPVIVVAFVVLGAAIAAPGAGGSTRAPKGDSGPAGADPLPPEYVSHSSRLYNNPAHWLCRPGMKGNSCDVNLDATVVNADGTTSIERHHKATDPRIDCFYVYPTISSDPTLNSDFHPDAPEVNVVQQQVARLNSTCRVFAPVYRQRTIAGLFGGATPNPPGRDETVGYSDVLDAFKMYAANYSRGRGFVLVGHSQGAGILRRLIAEEIDNVPALRARLVSAIIVGSTVAVPSIREVAGGDFANVPLCRKTGQIGCVITYASFRETAPPPPDSFFGRPRTTDGVAGCTNPAALGGSARPLTPYFRTDSIKALNDSAANSRIKTDWVTLPGLLRGQCVFLGGFSYLRVRVLGDPADPRVDNIPGDLTPVWGLHLVDMNLTMGDLEREVAAEAKTYAM